MINFKFPNIKICYTDFVAQKNTPMPLKDLLNRFLTELTATKARICAELDHFIQIPPFLLKDEPDSEEQIIRFYEVLKVKEEFKNSYDDLKPVLETIYDSKYGYAICDSTKNETCMMKDIVSDLENEIEDVEKVIDRYDRRIMRAETGKDKNLIALNETVVCRKTIPDS